MKKTVKLFSALLAIIMIALTFVSCGSDKTDNTTETTVAKKPVVASIDDLPGKKIGVQLGTTGDIYASDYEKEGSAIERYKKGVDAVQALKQGKIDCVIIDKEPAEVFISKNKDLKILEEPFAEEDYAIAVKKGNTALKNEINAAIAEIKSNGTLQKILDNYIGDNKGSFQYKSPANINYSKGTLIMATNAEFPPYEYIDPTTQSIVGIDVDMARAICDIMGYKLQINNTDFDSIINEVDSGKAQIGVAGMTVTEDRLKNIDFTDSYTTSTQVIIVKAN